MEQLKPCPFCGEDPELQETFNGTIIRCQNPECKVRVEVEDYFHTVAIAAWNKRAKEGK